MRTAARRVAVARILRSAAAHANVLSAGTALSAGALCLSSAPSASALGAPAPPHAAGAAADAELPLPSPAALRGCLLSLAASLPADVLETDADALAFLGRDAHSHHAGAPPAARVLARGTDDVVAAVRAAAAWGVPVIARAGGTSLEGHTVPPAAGLGRAIVVDVSGMDAVLAVRPRDLDCSVQAGVRWEGLNELLAPHGLFFPVDPGPGACVGGMAGTGASGTLACRHGAMKAHVLGLTAVLPDGRVVRTRGGSRARKSVAGYDLTSLLVGSEGTLGIVTELDLKLAHAPAAAAVAAVPFPDVASACDAVVDLLASGAGPAVGALELLDAEMVAAVNAGRGFGYARAPLLLVRLVGASAAELDAAAAAVGAAAAARGGGPPAVAPAGSPEGARLWEARKTALWCAAAADPARRVATTDVAVPLSQLPALMAGFEAWRAAARAMGEPAGALAVRAVAHAGDGNVHNFISFDPASADEAAGAAACARELTRLALALGGTCTGEHGVGAGKREAAAEELGPEAVALMWQIKDAIDPQGIMNPAKKLPPRWMGAARGAGGAGAAGGEPAAAAAGLLGWGDCGGSGGGAGGGGGGALPR